ncbi:MAG: DUF456 domain-containing protein [Anaerolineae bacterium]|jgi:uncharacterized protein YqgC (DUF456 family)|nr:DUF456 domain-containing protein [Ardenticatenia bacterium]MBK8539314.1 DUF456 domain-containing protein [Ardenticatenia bacterium]HQZ69966.1 DUF456 domain-containing protein [Anaerolineae bacterium]HRA20760.1 DUF456 domain-containing protein [Anaerolineae bacterium]
MPLPSFDLPLAETVVWIVMLLGLVGCAIPAVPGPPFMWLALAGYDARQWSQGQLQAIDLLILAAAFVLAVAGSTADTWLSLAVAHRAGASRRSVAIAMAVGLAMVLLAPFTGGLSIPAAVGLPFLTVVMLELKKDQDHQRSLRAGCGYVLGWGLAIAVETAAGLAIVTGWIVQLALAERV